MTQNSTQMYSTPVDAVSEHGLDELAQNADYASAQPLVAVLQVEHFVHEQQHDAQRDVLVHLKNNRCV